MKITYTDNNLVLTDVKDFCLEHIFECGQCFRWEKQPDASYIGVAHSMPLKIAQDGDTVTLYDTTIEQFYDVWYDYFDFATDYGEIKKALSSDSVLKSAAEFGSGIRLLNQDFWECTVSFIISQSNNIPRIKKIISQLCRLYGNKTEYLGKNFYSFPAPSAILNAPPELLDEVKAGFRDKYIMAAASYFSSGVCKSDFDLMSYDDAKAALTALYGVGPKVADCILLFSLGKRQSFPVDVWIKRVMEHFYFGSEQTKDKISAFAHEHFSDYGGYAQQYLFYYARQNKIGL